MTHINAAVAAIHFVRLFMLASPQAPYTQSSALAPWYAM